MITIMDLCEIGKIIISSIEGGPIVNKITALSHCVGDNKIYIVIKGYFILFYNREVRVLVSWQAKP